MSDVSSERPPRHRGNPAPTRHSIWSRTVKESASEPARNLATTGPTGTLICPRVNPPTGDRERCARAFRPCLPTEPRSCPTSTVPRPEVLTHVTPRHPLSSGPLLVPSQRSTGFTPGEPHCHRKRRCTLRWNNRPSVAPPSVAPPIGRRY